MNWHNYQKNILQSTIASKINVNPKGVYLHISKLHSILAVANLLAHNSEVKFVTAVKFYSSVAANCSFSDNLTPLGNIYLAGNGTSKFETAISLG